MALQALLDTPICICIYIARNRPPSMADRFAQAAPGSLGTSFIIWGELCFGADKSNDPKRAHERLARFDADVPVQFWVRTQVRITAKFAQRWAELFVISRCGNPARAQSLWHEDQLDRFDFSSSAMHVEVKSTVRGLRAHEFALEQLQSPAEGAGFVVSLMLQPLTGGIGVLDIAREVEAAVAGIPRLKQKLWENVAKALGSDFSNKLDKRFDQAFAERTLVVYLMNDIPRPDTPSDPRVTALRFVSDLTAVSSSLPGAPTMTLAHAFSDMSN